MKKIITLAAVLLAFTASKAQDTSVVYKPGSAPQQTYAFSFEPFQMFTGGFYTTYDQLIKSNNNIFRARLGLRVAEVSNYYEMDDVSEVHIEFQYRNMVSSSYNKLSGIYVSPFIGFKTIGFRERDGAVITPSPGGTTFTNPGLSAQAANFGFVMGIQRVFRSGFLFDVSFGGGMQLPFGDYEVLNTGSAFNPYNKGVIPKGTLNFGVAF